MFINGKIWKIKHFMSIVLNQINSIFVFSVVAGSPARDPALQYSREELWDSTDNKIIGGYCSRAAK